jgi:protein phosphatase
VNDAAPASDAAFAPESAPPEEAAAPAQPAAGAWDWSTPATRETAADMVEATGIPAPAATDQSPDQYAEYSVGDYPDFAPEPELLGASESFVPVEPGRPNQEDVADGAAFTGDTAPASDLELQPEESDNTPIGLWVAGTPDPAAAPASPSPASAEAPGTGLPASEFATAATPSVEEEPAAMAGGDLVGEDMLPVESTGSNTDEAGAAEPISAGSGPAAAGTSDVAGAGTVSAAELHEAEAAVGNPDEVPATANADLAQPALVVEAPPALYAEVPPAAPAEPPTLNAPAPVEPPTLDAPPAVEPPAVTASAAPESADTPFGTPPASPQTGPLTPAEAGTAEAGAVPDDSALPTTPIEPDIPMAPAPPIPAEGTTAKLEEGDVPEVAPPAPGDPFPALQPGDVVADRYQIAQVLQTGPQRQTYLAVDLKGYERCWACGSRENVQGEQYCTDCGAQLTGRTYRLFETPPEEPIAAVPAPLLENQHAGVAGVFDRFTDPATGRHYLVLEDVGGAPLNAGPGDQPLTDERILNWLHQAAATLQELHAARVIGCDFTPAALQVLADDRLVLTDPTACRLAGTAGDGRTPQAEAQADVQRVAAVLEQWYRGVRPDYAPAAPGETNTVAGVLARGREGGYQTAADFAGALQDILDSENPPADMQLVSGRASDVGVQRQLNEDSLFALECVAMEAAGNTPTGLYVVADGMGGHASGEVASSIAIRTIAGLVGKVVDGRVSGDSPPMADEALGKLLRDAILEANHRITQYSQERHNDMGTTVTMALVLGNRVTVANVGDSRTYLWREGKLHQISQDHSLVARLIAAGQLTAEEGRHFDRRNEIYRALGDAHMTADEIDIFHVRLRPLDALVLCSDGLWEMVRDEDIERIMLDAPDLPTAAQHLIDAANRNGGEDNISVIIAQALTASED